MNNSSKSTYIIAAISLVVIALAVYFLFIYQKSPDEIDVEDGASFVEDINDIDIKYRPFVTLTPESDALITISIQNMSYFDKIEFELTYQADNPQISGDKILRGSVGTGINTSQDKYKSSLLLGTASRGVKSPDTGIEDGILVLHLFKGDTEYVSESSWDRYQIGSIETELVDSSGNFSLTVPKLKKEYWVIIADTVGIPPGASFESGQAVLPIYGAFSIAPDFTFPTELNIKVDDEVVDAQLYSYTFADSSWNTLKSTLVNGTITARVDSFDTFVIVSE